VKTLRCLLCLSAGSLLLAVATAAVAQQGYPSRPVRVVVGWAPGGGTDYLARLVAQNLGQRLGQQFVVENRAGASGAIGADLVAKSAPDGYTVLFSEMGSLVITPHLEKVPYNTVRDFTAVSLLANMYHVLVVHPSLPARSVKELIALAKARPGEINYATSGSGSNMFIVNHLFKTLTDINMIHVPYKGAGPAAMAVLSGETQMMFSSITPVLQHVRSGRLVALAVTGPNRSPLLPEIPTLAEFGLREVVVATWYALLAPAATPREIHERLNAEVVKLAATPGHRQQLENQGFEPATSSPEQLSAFVKAEFEKWGRVIKDAGIKTD